MFLETVTFLGDDVLVAIKRIKYVRLSGGNDGHTIKIIGDDFEFEEYFKEHEQMCLRYKYIKSILKVK
jgi:hypothetical protein